MITDQSETGRTELPNMNLARMIAYLEYVKRLR